MIDHPATTNAPERNAPINPNKALHIATTKQAHRGNNNGGNTK